MRSNKDLLNNVRENSSQSMTKDNWFQIPLFIPVDGDQRRVSVKKIFIVDPHTMVRDGIKRILENTAGFSVVGEAENGIEILMKLETLDCDCVLFDISHQDGEGWRRL